MELLAQISDLVRQAGNIMLTAHDIEAQTTLKTSDADMVTAYDLKVEAFLKLQLPRLLPGSIFFGEEEKQNANPDVGWVFVVDPIDGTANFVRGFSQSAISVALARDGITQYACVFDPYKNELYTAKRGSGAYLNGMRIRVSHRPLAQGIFGMGTTPYNSSLHSQTMSIAAQLFARSCDFRRMGSAALDLCAVACGRLDLFFECQLSPWDYAAGILLITEAGGTVTTLKGTPVVLTEKCSVWASNAVNSGILQELEF